MASIVSDDMNSCSGSPLSYTTLESPQSSPSQQVPEMATTFKVYSSADKNLYQFGNNDNKPYLKITEQPQNHFRFRYDTEKSGSTHGCLLGRSTDKKGKIKTYPTVQLVNCSSKAMIKCTIKYYNNKKELERSFKILEDQHEIKSCKVPEDNCYKVVFRGIGIHTIKKSDLATILYGKLSERVSKNKTFDAKKFRASCDELAKSMNLNIVRLRFSAHDIVTGKEICEPVFSDPISNNKSAGTNALKICRISMYCGRSAGREDLFLLVDKIDKKDIEVHFYELDSTGKRVWFAKGDFNPHEVHYQCAIVCRTPPYDPQALNDAKVYIELVRPSDGSTSPPQEFLYKADEVYKQIKRRKTACRSWDTSVGDTMEINKPAQVTANEVTLTAEDKAATTQQTVESATKSDWDNLITSVLEQHSLDTVLDDTTTQAEQHGTVSSSTYNIYEVINLKEATDIHKLVVLPEVLQSQAEREPQETLNVYEAMESQVTMEPQEMVDNPMWGQQLGYHPQVDVSALSTSTEVSHMTAMDEEPDFFQEYASFFNIPDLNDIIESGTESKRLSLVGDSGRIKVEVSTSSTQTKTEEIDTNTEQSETDVVEKVSDGETTTTNKEDTPGTSDGEQTDAKESKQEKSNENQNPDAEKNAEAEEIRSTEKEKKIIQSENAGTSKGFKEAKTISEGTQTEASTTGIEKSKSEEDKSGDKNADGFYPAVFTPEDAEEIKKLVRELCEMMQSRRGTACSEVRARLERLFEIRLSNGDTFLHMTLFKNQSSFETLVKMIHSVKMSHLLNCSNNLGETVLHLAVANSDPAVVDLLVAKGCDPMAVTHEAETCIHYAVRYGSERSLRALLDASARHNVTVNLDARNAERCAALHLCALHGRDACAVLLCARGARVCVRDAAGRTALHLCAYDARTQVARVLLAHANAQDLCTTDGSGRTPLKIASERAPLQPEVAALLLAAGAAPEPELRPHLSALRPHLSPERWQLLADQLARLEDDEVKSDSEDPDEYESADDEYEDASPISLASRLEDLELYDDAESPTEIE